MFRNLMIGWMEKKRKTKITFDVIYKKMKIKFYFHIFLVSLVSEE